MRKLPALALIFLAACQHTEPFVPTSPEPLGPQQPVGERVTASLAGRVAASWAPDGNSIIYTWSMSNPSATPGWPTVPCISIIPREGGTRLWSMCETRGSHLDSVDVLGSPALSLDGRVIFLQAVYRRPATGAPLTAPVNTALWVADTADPLARRTKLFEAPTRIGDSVISWIDQPGWINPNTFIAVAKRFVAGSPGAIAPQPRYLIRGNLHQSGATLSQIQGTARAMSWSTAPNGDIIYLPGSYWLVRTTMGSGYSLLNDSTIWRVPANGGTPVMVARAPLSLEGISCAGNSCIANDYSLDCGPDSIRCTLESPGIIACAAVTCGPYNRTVYHLDLATGKLTIMATGARSGVRLRPDGAGWLYFLNRSIWQVPFVQP